MFKKFIYLGAMAILAGCACVDEGKLNLPQKFVDRIATEPLQISMQPEQTEINGYKVLKKFRYQIAARVLSTKSYADEKTGDVMTDDFLLAWNAAALPKYTYGLLAEQHDRFGYWSVTDRSVLAAEEVEFLINNTHIVPANEAIRKLVGEVGKGDYVYMEGYLINIYDKDGSGRYWSSSISRMDKGAGACEILLVEKLIRVPVSYALLKTLNSAIALSPIPMMQSIGSGDATIAMRPKF